MLGLPFVKISEESGTPELSGIALFSDKLFTGVTLDIKESTIIQVLRKKTGKQTLFHLYVGKRRSIVSSLHKYC